MIKQTMAALLLTTSVASAADMMMMDDGIQDKQIVDLSYVDEGKDITDREFDADNGTLVIDGRQGIVEYNVAFDSSETIDANVGLAVGVVGNFGVVAGVNTVDDADISADYYYGGIYEKGPIELRATYQDEADDYKVSGRYYVTKHWGVNAGVQFDNEIDEDSTYTVGISYKF